MPAGYPSAWPNSMVPMMRLPQTLASAVQRLEKWCVSSTSPDQIDSGLSAVHEPEVSGQAATWKAPPSL